MPPDRDVDPVMHSLEAGNAIWFLAVNTVIAKLVPIVNIHEFRGVQMQTSEEIVSNLAFFLEIKSADARIYIQDRIPKIAPYSGAPLIPLESVIDPRVLDFG
jgi:hypothetical protein